VGFIIRRQQVFSVTLLKQAQGEQDEERKLAKNKIVKEKDINR